MPGSLYNADNVVVGQAVLLLSPWVAGAVVTPPLADAVALFTDPPAAPWVSAGATSEGFKANVATSVNDVNIEEQSTPVGQTVTAKKVTFSAALAEDSLEAMRMSWGGSVITTIVAAAGVAPKRTMTLDDNMQYYTGTLEMRNQTGFARRIYVPKLAVSGSGDVAFRRAAGPRLHPVTFSSVCKPTDIQIVDLTGPVGP